MHEAVKEGYGGEEGYEGDYHSTRDFWGLAGICREESGVREWEGLVHGHWFAGGFGHGGPRYPYDILELGS
jgi:hypothetical protein